MTKKRTNRKANDKKRRNLWIIVGLLFFTILTLGAGIAYKVLTKQAFEQKIEALKKEKDDSYSQGSQKDHFRKGQAEIITYYPMTGDKVITPVQDIIVKDITDKVEDKEDLIFYYSEKDSSSIKGVESHLVKKQVYDLSNSTVVELENTSLDQLYPKEDGTLFTLDQLFTDASKA